MSGEPAILVVMRVKDLGQPNVGSNLGVCSICEAPVWIGPDSDELLRSVGYLPVLVCASCVVVSTIEDDKDRVMMALVKTKLRA